MSTLVELVEEYQMMAKILDESYGELNPHFEALLEEIPEKISTKSDGYGSLVEGFTVQAERLKKAEEDFYKARKSIENKLQRLKDRIKWAMERMNKKEILGDKYKAQLIRTAPKLAPYAPEMVPEEFKKTKIEVKVDEAKLKAALAGGLEFPGLALEENRYVKFVPNKG